MTRAVDSGALDGNHAGMRLAVVPPDPTDAGCAGCSRRVLLQGFAVTAAAALVGCRTDDTILQTDAGPGSITTACGNNLCLDLGDPLNAALTQVDGSLVVTAPRDRIIVVRTSDTAAQAVSDVCTHAACGVRYDHVNRIFSCPCHGSTYAMTGAVLQGPATRPLARYQTQLDLSANQLTIFL
ncbi:MAG TPA: Rieske 2Fe-2S domain-containing protein [Kofleriaceae bacterium]